MNSKHLLNRWLSSGALALVFWMAAQVAYGAADITVQGRITSGDDGAGLPGVNIVVKGTSIGTTTDSDGRYTLSVPNTESVLVITFIGYKTQEVVVGSQTTIDVELAADIETLTEVVVVGYGEQKRETLTGSISQVKGDDIIKSPQPNVSNSLAGRFSGIIANNRGGEPGYDGSSYSIRGLATTGNNDVLVVIDGIPGQLGGLERLNPNDIESISILKDASAAVYGSRAANGVILVTTKRGKSGAPVISYSYNQGFSSPTRIPKMADAATYATIQNEIDYYNNSAGGMNQHYTEAQIQKFRDGSDPLNYPNTDWADVTLKKVTLQNQHNLSIKGGTDDVKYYLSLGKIYQDGIYKHGATNYNQYNFRTNIDATISKSFKMSLSLNGRQEDRHYPAAGAGDIFRSIYRAYPTVAATYPNGMQSTGVELNNPVAMVTAAGGTNKNPISVFNGILRASYVLPVKGFSIDGFYAADKTWNFSKSFSTPYTLYQYNSADGTYTPKITGGSGGKAKLVESQENNTMLTENLKLNYERQMGNHYVNAFVAYEQSKTHRDKFDATRINYPTAETPELSQGGASASDATNSGSSFNYNRRSYIGRAAYNFREKYLLEAQMRIDGTSTFPKGHQYGYFPAVSAGWRISEEGWFDNVSFINDLKIRGSHGTLGNDNVDAFQYFNNYSLNAFNYVLGSTKHDGVDLTKLANTGITWEVAKKTDVGINGKVFKNFNFEFIYFYQDREKILMPRNASIPALTGIVNPYDDPNDNPDKYVSLVPYENIGRVKSKGIEATVGYEHHGDFWWAASGNVTYARSEVIYMDEASGTLDYQRKTGKPLNNYLLYNAIGIFRTQADLDSHPHVSGAKLGDLIFEDYNKDGQITADDQVRTKQGNIPQITYGLNLTGGWKNFDIAILFSGQARVRQYVLPESGTVGNFYSSWADNRWTPTNINGSYPRVDTRASDAVSGGRNPNTFWLNDASFVRLKNISIGYNVPVASLSKYRVSGLRIYANAFNVFTISKVKDYDPEGSSQSGQFYPQQRIINVGVNVTF